MPGECLANAKTRFSVCKKELEKDNGHSLVPVPRKSGTVSVETVHKENGIIWRKGCCWNSQKVDVQISVQQLHCPRVYSSKGHGKLSIHFVADLETIETIFRIILFANQLSLYGAIAEICEEYETLHERTVRPVVMGQSSSSLVLSVIKTEVPWDCDDPANKDLLLKQYGPRIEKLSQQDKLCGEEELVRQVHTLFVRSAQQVQVVYELQVLEEVEGVRQEVRVVEGESKARRNAHMIMNMWMG